MSYEYGNEKNISIGNKIRNSGIYTKTLFGQSIQENPVTTWTADKENSPFLDFRDPKTGKVIGMSKGVLSLGCLALAAPGGGKTNLYNMVLSRLLATQGRNDIIIVFDTKGDYLKEFSNRIADRNKVVVGAGEEYSRLTGYHNIFAEIMPRSLDGKLVYTKDSDTDALEISKQLFQKMNSEVQPVFPAMSEQIFAGIMIYFMRTYQCSDQSKLNNKELIHFLLSSTNDELKAVFGLEYMKDQRSCINYIAGKSNQTQGVNSYIGSVLKEIFIGPFAEAAPDREFSMRNIVKEKEKMIIFIEYDLKRGQTLAPMYGILIDRTLAYALGGREDIRKNVYLLLDEMALLPKIMHMSNALSFGRSQGVKVLAGLQNISAVEELYGEAGAKNILAGFQNIFTFKLTDYDTRQFLINRLGENYQNHSFSAQQENIHIQRNGHTVEEWDLLTLGPGQGIVSLAGEKPFIFTMPKYER